MSARQLRRFYTPLCLLILTALTACSSLQQIADVQKPQASVTSASVKSLSLDQATVLVDVVLTNPNPFTLHTVGFDMNMAIDGHRLAAVSQPDSKLAIPANGRNKMQLPVTLKYQDVIAAVGSIANENALNYALDGTVFVDVPVLGKLGLPLKFTGSLPVPRLPQISLKDISLESISLSGAKLKVDLDVTNPNIFDVNLKSVNYDLMANGKSLTDGALKQINLRQGQTQNVTIPLSVSTTNMGLTLYRLLSGSNSVTMGVKLGADIVPGISAWQPGPLKYEAQRTLSR
ncbi:LEA type 2 family protein [Gynuella sunshinyii]|uniref:Conserved secreted protein n=1 Tax=Gynuella sunshinyii YC6258 TaxID=1445510 RepID=A0A0C5VF40_9GAMM|nr:LEA type 2 family protein [Gynuella sunshinyii]AJQ92756.1 conserved secreted protein [Gynuella sunshinyii YC6258]